MKDKAKKICLTKHSIRVTKIYIIYTKILDIIVGS